MYIVSQADDSFPSGKAVIIMVPYFMDTPMWLHFLYRMMSSYNMMRIIIQLEFHQLQIKHCFMLFKGDERMT